MKQLVLDLMLPQPAGFSGFVPGDNAELLFMLGDWLSGSDDVRFLYLWGGAGVGKSHLLDATLERLPGAIRVDARIGALPTEVAADAALIVDNVDALDFEQQIRLFDHYNTLREGSGRLLAAGPLPPMLLDLRDDLTTRLGWGLVYQLKGLSDHNKAAVLQQLAHQLGFELADEACDYLLQHASRDLADLQALIARANRYALSLRRPVTLPLLREVLGGADHAGS